MTDQGPGNGQSPAPPAAAPPLSPAFAGLMIFIGIIALLPGICAVTFMVGMALPGGTINGGFVTLWLVCLAISAGGIWLIRAARRRRKPQIEGNIL